MSPEEMRRIETQWKSDVDFKLDQLITFVKEYEDYLKLCLERERDKKALRDAVIEKSLVGAVWGIIVFFGIAAWAYIKDHVK